MSMPVIAAAYRAQWKNNNRAKYPVKTPMMGLRTANQNETSQPELVTVVDFI
jgi:hypothetical protein